MHHERVGLVINERLQVQVRRRRGLPGELEELAVGGNAAELRKGIGAVIRLVVVQVIILQADFAPLAEVQVHVRPQAHAALGPIVQVELAVGVGAEIPVVAAQQKPAVAAAEARRHRKIIRAHAEVALVVGKIKDRHAFGIKHRVPHLHILSRHNLDAAGADLKRRIRNVVRRHKGFVRVINAVAGIARQIATSREHRPLARAELFALQLVRFEIIADVVAHPKLVARLDAHIAVRHHFAGLRVQRHRVRRQVRVAVFHINPVRARRRAAREIVIHLALHRAGNDFA